MSLFSFLFPEYQRRLDSMRQEVELKTRAYKAACSMCDKAEDKVKAISEIAAGRLTEIGLLTSAYTVTCKDLRAALVDLATTSREALQERSGRQRFMALSEKWKGLFWNQQSPKFLLPQLQAMHRHWILERKRADNLYEALENLAGEIDNLDCVYRTGRLTEALRVAKIELEQPRPIRY